MPGQFDKERGSAGISYPQEQCGGELAIRPLEALLLFPVVEEAQNIGPHTTVSLQCMCLDSIQWPVLGILVCLSAEPNFAVRSWFVLASQPCYGPTSCRPLTPPPGAWLSLSMSLGLLPILAAQSSGWGAPFFSLMTCVFSPRLWLALHASLSFSPASWRCDSSQRPHRRIALLL